MANKYDQGDKVRVKATFTDPFSDPADQVTDPTTVKLSVKKPDGTRTTYTFGTDSEVEKVSTGVYRSDLTIDQDGEWLYRWFSETTAEAAEEKSFIINDSLVEAAGPGSDKVPTTLINDGEPLKSSKVWITSDSQGNTIVAGPLTTNEFGKAIFYLTAATTYYYWAQRDGYKSIRGQSFAAATTGHTFSILDKPDDDTIWEHAQSPMRVSTDEGTVVERPIDELIKAANRKAADNVGDKPLHGLRISRCKPAGPV